MRAPRRRDSGIQHIVRCIMYLWVKTIFTVIFRINDTPSRLVKEVVSAIGTVFENNFDRYLLAIKNL